MVRPVGETTPRSLLSAGDICMVRGFSGRYEYSFLSEVLQIAQEPCTYAVLSHPPYVEARTVRQSLRAKAAWPTRVKPAGAARWNVVEMVDIGTGGAMVQQTKTPRVGGMMRVRNEERFIKESLTSLLRVATAGVVVFDDNSTDDTTPINNAFTAAEVSGGCVYFPAGIYRITSLINRQCIKRLCNTTQTIFVSYECMFHISNRLIEFHCTCIRKRRYITKLFNFGKYIYHTIINLIVINRVQKI
jgi:hypothetical protein